MAQVGNGRSIPLPVVRAEAIAGQLIDVALVLMESPASDAPGIERLIECAEVLLDHRGEWLSRPEAVAIWATILDDGVIPLEATDYLGAAEALLQVHDEFTQALIRW